MRNKLFISIVILMLISCYVGYCQDGNLTKAQENLIAEHFQKASAFDNAEKYAEASQEYEKIIAINPNIANVLNAYAWMICTAKDEKFRKENLPKAIKYAEKAVSLEPKSSAILDTLAEANYASGNLKNAVAIETKAVSLSQTPQELIGSLEKYINAYINQLEKTNGDKQEIGNLYYTLAASLANVSTRGFTPEQTKQHLQKIKTSLDKSITAMPNSTDARILLGRVKLFENNFEEAITIFKDVLKIKDELPYAHYNLAKAYKSVCQTKKLEGNEKEEHYKKVLTHLLRAEKLDPKLPNNENVLGIKFEIGRAYYELQDYDKALASMDICEKRVNQSKNVYKTLRPEWYMESILATRAECYEGKNKFRKAMDTYAQTLIKRGADSMCEVNIDKLYKKLVDKKKVADEGSVQKFYAKKYNEKTNYFVNVTEKVGMKDAKGNRVALADYDNDGDVDILLSGPYLWQNDGKGNFTNVTNEVGLGARHGHCIWADVNNDGLLDFFLGNNTQTKEEGDCIYVQTKDHKFKLLETAKVADTFRSDGCSWGDYDADGFIDLFVGNHEKARSNGTPDFLYKNNGDGTFTDVTKKVGITDEILCAYGSNWGDFDNDGDLDLFVSNYRLQPNYFWRNNGDGTFTDIADLVGVKGVMVKGAWGHTIGSAWGDFDNDGDLDLFCANLAHPRFIEFSNKSYLYVNSGGKEFKFKDNRVKAGIRYEETHSDPSWVDYDNDGDLDLYITSIYVGCKSYLYRNNGDGTFTDVTWFAGVRIDNGWGHAWADLDNDGDMDLVATGGNIPQIFMNEGNKNSWLKVKLTGSHCNNAAIGARVTVKTSKGNLTQMREVEGGRGTTSQDSLMVEFGFGKYDGEVDVEIRWPCGKIEKIKTKLNKTLQIKEK